jgi:drug/metabolite transporter (DMT)-like permease/HAMP domain-containing protein
LSRTHLRPYLYLAAGVLLQGVSPVLTKLLLSELSASTLVAGRYLVAVVCLLPFGWRPRPAEDLQHRPRRRDWVALILVGALGSGLASLLFTHAIELTSAGIANAVSKTAPIFVAVFAYLTLRERITSARLLLVLVMVGADILIGAGELRVGGLAGARLQGDLLAVGAGVLRAMAEVLSKASLRRFYPSTVALWRFGVGFLVTGAIALAGGGYRALFALDARGWLLLLALGGLCTSLSMALYYRGLRDIPAHVAVSLRLTSAIVTVILSWLVLDESLNPLHLAGIVVLVAGSYLIVMRSARRPASVAEPPAPPGPVFGALTGTLRGRVALLVSAMVAITVLASTLLSVQHNQAVVNEQARLTMASTATMVLQLRGVAQAPSPETYRQYLDRIIRPRISGRFYSLEIMYLAVLDGQGNLIAYAKRDGLTIRDQAGRPLTRPDTVTGLRLLEMVDSGELARTEDVIPLSAELERGGQVIGIVRMGCKRSLAYRAATEIALRNLTLAVLLVLVGIAVSYELVGHLARPLEKLAAVVRRIAAGELDAPLLSQGSAETESLGLSVAHMVEQLRIGRLLQTSLAQQAARGSDGGPATFVGQVALLARPGATGLADREQPLEALLQTVARHEGRLTGVGAGHVLVGFGGDELEQDDVLRVVVAAMEWVEAAGELSGEATAIGLVALPEPGAAADEVLTDLSAQLARARAAANEPMVLVTSAVQHEIEPYLRTEGVGETDLHRVLNPAE